MCPTSRTIRFRLAMLAHFFAFAPVVALSAPMGPSTGGGATTDKADDLDERAARAAQAGDYARAIADLDEEIKIAPTAGAYSNRGLVYGQMGEHRRAIADDEEAIRLDPKLDSPYVNRCLAYDHIGEFDRAIADCNHAIALVPDNPRPYVNRGLAHKLRAPGLWLERWRRSEYTLAIADFDKAISLAPSLVDTYYDRGLAYEGRGDLARALADLRKVVAINPSDAAAGAALARIRGEIARRR